MVVLYLSKLSVSTVLKVIMNVDIYTHCSSDPRQGQWCFCPSVGSATGPEAVALRYKNLERESIACTLHVPQITAYLAIVCRMGNLFSMYTAPQRYVMLEELSRVR